MALTHVGAPVSSASIGGALQRPQEHRPAFSFFKCKLNHRAQPLLSTRPSSKCSVFLQGGNAEALKALSSTRSPQPRNTSRRARAALAETGTDNASSSETAAPKERIIEIDPFEIPKASPLQTAASLALTSLIGVLLFRSARRRAKRATGVVRKLKLLLYFLFFLPFVSQLFSFLG